MTAQLQFRNLTLGYDRHPAVHHLDGAVRIGSLTAVVGPNGAGKSTLFKGVVGVIKPLAGRIERNGVRPQDIAYLPQVAEIDRTFPDQRLRHGGDGLVARAKACSAASAPSDRDTVEGAIAAVGLTGFEPRPIGTLSGGQMQRMLFARLLLQDARVIVLDEPFNAIDAKTSRRSAGTGAALAFASSAPCWPRCTISMLVKANFPETLLLAREPVAWGATADVLTPDNMLKARRMCEAFDEQAEACVVAEAV